VTPKDFGRIAAQTAKQVMLQRIREAERDQLFIAMQEREGEILQGTVQSINAQEITVALNDKVEAVMPRAEQIPTERYYPGQRLRVYVVEVKKNNKGPQVIVSRTHRSMLKRLMELEVPEIFNGAVEIKAIAREAGSRSKVAVAARQEGVDPVGACVGMRGVRIQALVNELGGEKIDIVEWSPDPTVFIAHALSPAQVVSVRLIDSHEGKTASVVVPDKQLSLAIGKEGQNARLAAKLTGSRIDIRSESEAQAEAVQRVADEARRAEQQAALEAARALLLQAESLGHDEKAEGAESMAGAAEAAERPAVALAEETAPAVEAAAEAPAMETPASAEEALPVPAAEFPGTEAQDGEDEEEGEGLDKKGKKKKGKATKLIFDERLGQVVAHKTRKATRVREDWHDQLGRWSQEQLEEEG
jgi:N utilization substance protein A